MAHDDTQLLLQAGGQRSLVSQTPNHTCAHQKNVHLRLACVCPVADILTYIARLETDERRCILAVHQSASGTKRTSPSALHMSAIGGKADIRLHRKCPLLTQSRHPANPLSRNVVECFYVDTSTVLSPFRRGCSLLNRCARNLVVLNRRLKSGVGSNVRSSQVPEACARDTSPSGARSSPQPETHRRR